MDPLELHEIRRRLRKTTLLTHKTGWPKRLAQVLVAAVAVTAVAVAIDGRVLAATLAHADWRLVLPALLLVPLLDLLPAMSWWLLVTAFWTGQRNPPSAGWAIRTFYASAVVGLVGPGNITGDSYRVLTASRAGLPLRFALGAVAFQKLSTVFATFALVGLGWLVRGGHIWTFLLVFLAAMCSVSYAVLRLKLAPNSRSACWVSPAQAMCVVSLGMAYHGLAAALGCVLARSLNAPASLLETFAALLAVRLAALLPISVSGIGITEGAAALAFKAVGLSAEVGVGVAILQRAGRIVGLLAIALVAHVGRGRRRSDPTVPAETVPPSRAAA